MRTYTPEELAVAADKLEGMGHKTPAVLARKGYPALAAFALKREREEKRKADAA